jgi:hypothetical protein
MQMKLCKTCSHWDRYESKFATLVNSGKCHAVVQYWDYTDWAADGESRIAKTEYKDKLAFVQDGSDYYAELQTLENFGCVQHKDK